MGLHLRWRGVWQRPNHVLSRIARDVPVVVLEEPLLASDDEDAVETFGGVTVVTPHRRTLPGDALDEAGIAAVRRALGNRRPLVWLYTPMMLALADAFPGAPLIYDKMDELAKFAQADPRIAPRENELLARAGIVFTGGRSLFRTVEHRAAVVRCYPSGVDVEHFAAARSAAPHAELAPYAGRPVFGYVGVIDERIDLPLVAALADRYPDAVVAMVGPLAKIEAGVLPRRPNLVYLGKREYHELPSLLAGFAVALMPFALNEHTVNISPTKTLEYLAAGLPVVSTAVPDVIADHAGVVYVAGDRDEFVALVDRARAGDAQRAARGDQKAHAATWDAIAAAMREDARAAGIDYAAASPARKQFRGLGVARARHAAQPQGIGNAHARVAVLDHAVGHEAPQRAHDARTAHAEHHRDHVLRDLDLVADAVARREEPFREPLLDGMARVARDPLPADRADRCEVPVRRFAQQRVALERVGEDRRIEPREAAGRLNHPRIGRRARAEHDLTAEEAFGARCVDLDVDVAVERAQRRHDARERKPHGLDRSAGRVQHVADPAAVHAHAGLEGRSHRGHEPAQKPIFFSCPGKHDEMSYPYISKKLRRSLRSCADAATAGPRCAPDACESPHRP